MGLREYLAVKLKHAKEQPMVNTITINGNTVVNGNIVGGDLSISANGDKILINGKEVYATSDKNITVVIHGNTGSINTTSGGVNVYGTAGNIKTVSGDVHVEKGALADVTTVSGDVIAETIEGNVRTVSGDVSHRR
nr:MAG: hypothetical protein [Bacteriophage sp.]